MSEQSYRNWLEPVKFSHVGPDRSMHLVAPNSDVQDWVESELSSNIVTAAHALRLNIRSVSIETAGPDPRPVQQEFNFRPKSQTFNQKYTFNRFVVGACNEFAHAAAQAVSHRPATAYNPLYLYSGVGMGKTHLLHAVGHRLQESSPSSRIVYISAEEFMNEMIKSIRYNKMRDFHQRFRMADALLVDDIQVLGSKERTQEEFFHTFEALHNRSKQIVISSDSDPQSIPGMVDRLKSRFAWGLMADIQAPDLETKLAILDRKSEEVGVALPEDVRDHIATHLNSNIRELEGVLNRLIARSHFINAKITMGMVRSLFEGLGQSQSAGPSLAVIKHTVATEVGVPLAELTGRNSHKEVVRARQIAMYLSKRLTNASLTAIGKSFGKHHTTVLHSVAKIDQALPKDTDLKDTVDYLRSKLNH